ncbi:MAG TPA: aminotransferase class I/II-fold pyridoxal phosphate-dependent enzyme [Candidatus Gastranaerophilales bacterium]|nr:aminotransferase class I/II-fold pyridoxal phosphate-dependent enzyme [Candidatus Gastranaerophilales bacterium]
MQSAIDIKKLYSDYVKTLETYIMFRISQRTLELTPELEAKNRKPINLSIGAPIQAPPQLVTDVLKNCLNEPGISAYSTPKGEKFFLEAIAARMKTRFGVELDTKTEIFSLIGSKEGLANIFRCLVNPTLNEKDQDIILIPDPGYASYAEQIKVIGGKAYPMPLTYENNFMPCPKTIVQNLEKEGFSSSKIKALVINYPNNPLGATATRDYLKKIVDFCRERNILLISDAAYADMYFAGQEAPASILEFEGAKDIAIEFHSLSKPYSMTGWRMGWACGNKDAVGILGKIKSTVDTGLFKALQKAGAAILTSPEGDEYIKKSNAEFQKKQEILVKGFKELGWDVDNLIIPKATFYLWLPIPARFKNSEDFCNQLLEKAGVVSVPGTGFGKYGEGFFRLSISPGEQALYEVIKRMKEDGFTFN